jgi:hypothetical protein
MKKMVTGDQILKLLENHIYFNFDNNNQQSIHYRWWCERTDSVAPGTFVSEENYLRKMWLTEAHMFREIMDMVH